MGSNKLFFHFVCFSSLNNDIGYISSGFFCSVEVGFTWFWDLLKIRLFSIMTWFVNLRIKGEFKFFLTLLDFKLHTAAVREKKSTFFFIFCKSNNTGHLILSATLCLKQQTFFFTVIKHQQQNVKQLSKIHLFTKKSF